MSDREIIKNKLLNATGSNAVIAYDVIKNSMELLNTGVNPGALVALGIDDEDLATLRVVMHDLLLLADKQRELALYLDVDTKAVKWIYGNEFAVVDRNEEYLILNDDEANDEVSDYIRSSLEYFNSSFLAKHCKLPESVIKILQGRAQTPEFQQVDLSALFYSLCADFSTLVADAIEQDGRGHFLSMYDRKEIEYGGYFFYRTN